MLLLITNAEFYPRKPQISGSKIMNFNQKIADALQHSVKAREVGGWLNKKLHKEKFNIKVQIVMPPAAPSMRTNNRTRIFINGWKISSLKGFLFEDITKD